MSEPKLAKRPSEPPSTSSPTPPVSVDADLDAAWDAAIDPSASLEKFAVGSQREESSAEPRAYVQKSAARIDSVPVRTTTSGSSTSGVIPTARAPRATQPPPIPKTAKQKRGLTEAFWSIDTLDWQARNADKLRKKIFKMIVKQDGGVVLMHDVKPITAEIIANVLDDLEAENCKRLDEKREPIYPVSIHYFLRDKKKPRDIPDDVKKTTDAYKTALPARCAARPKPVEPDEKKVDEKKVDEKKVDEKKVDEKKVDAKKVDAKTDAKTETKPDAKPDAKAPLKPAAK